MELKELKEKKVLVVEGDFINSYILKQYLDNDFKMLYAKNSFEFEKIMNANTIDLVLLNTQYTSYELNPNELIKYIKNKDKENHIKIVALKHNNENTSNLLEKDCNGFMEMPHCKDEILKKIIEILKN